MKKTVFLISAFLYTWQAMAGWEITQKVSDQDGMVSYDVMLIHNNILKFTGDDVGFIINTNRDELTFIMDQNKTYWKGNPDEFRNGLNTAMKKFMEQMMAQIPETQREMYSEMLGDMSDMYKTPQKQEIKNINIEIVNTGETEEIAGYDTEKFLVNVDGTKKETLWISEQLNPGSDLNIRKAYEMMNKIRPNVEDEILYEYSDAYLDLISKGFLMKSTESGGESVEVIKVVERNISDAEVSLPQGFKEVSIDEMLRQQMMTGDENDDNGGW